MPRDDAFELGGLLGKPKGGKKVFAHRLLPPGGYCHSHLAGFHRSKRAVRAITKRFVGCALAATEIDGL